MHAIYILSVIIGIFIIFNLVIKIKNRKILINEIFFWIIILALIILICIFPLTAVRIAGFFGFDSGFDFFIALTLLSILLFLFNIYKKQRNIEQKLNQLIEKLALRNESEKEKNYFDENESKNSGDKINIS